MTFWTYFLLKLNLNKRVIKCNNNNERLGFIEQQIMWKVEKEEKSIKCWEHPSLNHYIFIITHIARGERERERFLTHLVS